MAFENIRVKITRHGFEFEKKAGGAGRNRAVFERWKKRPNSEKEPGTITPERKVMLRMGGWSDEEIKRMSKQMGKRKIKTDGGYMF